MIDRPSLRALARSGLLVALFLVAPAARAAPASNDDATSQRIADLYKRANALYDQKKLTEAEPLYREAWGLKQTYDVACNLGAIELDLGKPREAAEYFAFALREFPAGGKTTSREQLKARLALARAQVGAVHVRVNVAGAQVTIGDRVVGKSPIENEVFVSPGVVTVNASAPGYQPAAESVTVAKGGSTDVVLTLKEPRRSAVPGAVLGGVAGAALVTAIGLTAAAFNKRSTVQDLSKQIGPSGSCVPSAGNFSGLCASLQSATTTGDTLGRAGVGLFVGAGAAALASTLYFVWPASKPGTTSGGIGIAPVVSTTGGAMMFSGAF